MQFQAYIMDKPVQRPQNAESTAMGAAYLAGLAVGFWNGLDEIKQNAALDREFLPAMEETERVRLLHGWEKAVARAKHWED